MRISDWSSDVCSSDLTNMAKAALNMLTRTSAREMLESDGILMTSVDTGWITDERPHPTKSRMADEGFHAPRSEERRVGKEGVGTSRPRWCTYNYKKKTSTTTHRRYTRTNTEIR